MGEKLLEIKDYSVTFTSDKVDFYAVNHVNLTVNKGEVLGLVGETGAGKTTTALSIMGLLSKYGTKTSGEIWFNGKQLTGMKAREYRKIRGKHISMIFQDPMTSLNPVFRVGDQIADVIKIHNPKIGQTEVNERVNEIMNMVGISAERKLDYPHQFSGGMKQRIVIAIAIACNPELLIADEPTTALDVTIQAQVIKMMRALRSKLGSSVILITHDLGIVANFCDKVAIMYGGEIVESGTLEEIYDKSFPHHPYTVGLFNSIPNIEEKTERLKPITGLTPHPSELPEGCKFHPRCPECMDKCKSGDNPPLFTTGTHCIQCHLYSKGEK